MDIDHCSVINCNVSYNLNVVCQILFTNYCAGPCITAGVV